MDNQPATSQYDLDVEFAVIYAKDPKKAYKEDSEDEKVEGESHMKPNDAGAHEENKAGQSKQQVNQEQDNNEHGK